MIMKRLNENSESKRPFEDLPTLELIEKIFNLADTDTDLKANKLRVALMAELDKRNGKA